MNYAMSAVHVNDPGTSYHCFLNLVHVQGSLYVEPVEPRFTAQTHAHIDIQTIQIASLPFIRCISLCELIFRLLP